MAAEPEIRMQLDVIAREGARQMLAAALRAEVAEYLEAADGDRDELGHALVTSVACGWWPCRRMITPVHAGTDARPATTPGRVERSDPKFTAYRPDKQPKRGGVGSRGYATAAAKAAYKSPGSAWVSSQVIAMGFSPT
jgi:hypothetical protein